MLFPFIPDYSGAIDPHKVRSALFRYRLVVLWVFAVNVFINTAFIFFLVGDMGAALVIVIAYISVGLFVALLASIQKRDVSINILPECIQPDTLLYKELAAMWTDCCRQEGYRSGSVYLIRSIPDTELEHIQNFCLLHSNVFTRTPILLIAERMLKQFSINQLRAGVLHECGHLRNIPLVVRYLVEIVSLPMSMTLRIIAQLRSSLRGHLKILASILYRLERCLHFVSMFAVNHADEYSADAYAVGMQNTPKHLISVLELLEGNRQIHFGTVVVYVRINLTTGRESHQHTHPYFRERIRRMSCLRKDHP